MNNEIVGPVFEPDPAAIRKHLHWLFRRCEPEYPGGLCEIAWADPAGAIRHAELFPVTDEGLNRATECAAARNREHRNIYVGVNPRKPHTFPGGRADAADVEIAFFNFVDVDNQEGADLLQRAPLPFSLAVLTGRHPSPRIHAYWELDDPIRNMTAWGAQQCALRDHFKGDSVVDPPRVMRLAGTVNYPAAHKISRGYKIENVTIRPHCEDDNAHQAVTSCTLATVYPASRLDLKASADARAGNRPNFGASGSSIETRLAAIRNGREWHNDTRDLVASMVASGYERGAILGLADHITLPGYTVDQTVGELTGFYDSAVTKFGARPAGAAGDADGDFNPPPPGRTLPDPNCLMLSDWLRRDIRKPDFLLGEILSTTSRMLLVAPTGIGKTNFAMAAAMHIATGEPFLHWNAPRPGRVLYIDGEMSERLMRVRLEDIVRRAGGQIPDALFVLNRQDFPDLPPLNSVAGQQCIGRIVDLIGGVDVIFFDNIQSLLVGDMKDEESWQQTLPWVRDLTRRNIGQVWVHHTGHDEGKAYGTKTREWQLDNVALLTRVEQPGADIAFTLSFTKCRERAPHNRSDFSTATITLKDDEWQVDSATFKPQTKPPSPLAQKFFAALLDALSHGGKPRKESANIPSATMREWRAECNRLGLLDSDVPDNRIRALFSKYRRELIAANWIACNGDFAWSIK